MYLSSGCLYNWRQIEMQQEKISVAENRDKEMSYRIISVDGRGGGGSPTPRGQTFLWCSETVQKKKLQRRMYALGRHSSDSVKASQIERGLLTLLFFGYSQKITQGIVHPTSSTFTALPSSEKKRGFDKRFWNLILLLALAEFP